MTITFVTGDLFDTQYPAIGQGVNIKGLMGSGIAPVIRNRFPAVYPPYKKACDEGTLLPGMMLPVEVEPGFWVFNLASQDLPGANANLDWLEASLEETFKFCKENAIPGFSIPRIGAGIGGLDWADVKPLLIEVSERYPDIELEVVSLPGAPD